MFAGSAEHAIQMKEACKDVGHSVASAQTIEEALAFMNGADHVDVIVCAAYLQDESLFDFLTRLQGDPVHKKAMFMILALAPGPVGIKLNESVEIAGNHLGADAFVSMPEFDPVLLISEIKKLLPSIPRLQEAVSSGAIGQAHF